MISAVHHRYRRFEIRFREEPADSPPLPVAPDREPRQVEDEPYPEEADDRAVELGCQHGRFVRQPVKVRLIPRWRLVR